MNTIVEDYKIENMTQAKIDEWLAVERQALDSEICINVKSSVNIQLDSNNLIQSEKTKRIQSHIQLWPNKAMNSRPSVAGKLRSEAAPRPLWQR